MDNLSFAQNILAKKTKKIYQKRNKKIIPLDEIKDVLLIIDLDNISREKDINWTISKFKTLKKKIKVVGLTKNKSINRDFDIVFYKTFLWKVKFLPEVNKLLDKHFDLVLNYGDDYNLILQYFANQLSTNLIIQPFYQEPDFADIAFKTKDGALKNLVEQTVDFLNTIKNK